jgi:surface protein
MATEFIFTVDTTRTETNSSDSTSVRIPLNSATSYNFNVDWGDGTFSGFTYSGATVPTTPSFITKTYAVSGTYDIKISGIFPRIWYNNTATNDKLKIINIKDWGNIVWSSFNTAFNGCSNLDVTATEAPVLSGLTDLTGMFRLCSSLVGNSTFNTWNTSTVTNISTMFQSATLFNAPISSWNTSNVTQMVSTFSNATSFNQPIGSWNTSSVATMNNMFSNRIYTKS